MGEEHSSWNWRLKGEGRTPPTPTLRVGGERALADVSLPPLPHLCQRAGPTVRSAECRVPCAGIAPEHGVRASLSQQALHPLGVCPSSQPPHTPPLNLSSHPPYSYIPPYIPLAMAVS